MIKKFNTFSLLSTNEDLNDPRLNKQAKGKIRNALTSTISFYNFFADLFFQLNISEASPNSGVDTMATDGMSILYNPDFVNNKLKNVEEVAFVLIHEVMHNANLHFHRQGGRDHELWNYAADYAINLQIYDMSKERPDLIQMPSMGLFDEKYRDMSAEQIYEILKEEEDKNGGGQDGEGDGDGDGEGQDGQGQGKSGQGKGKSKPGKGKGGESVPAPNDIREPGSLSGDKKGPTLFDGSKELEDSDSTEDLAKKWGEILNRAKTQNSGTGSASLDRWFNKIGKPKVNWKSRLIKFMNKCFSNSPKYGYFNKRFLGQDDPIYLPGMKYPKDSGFRKVVLCIDTSGSIDDETLGKFAAEIYGVFNSKKIEEAIIIWCDDDIPTDGIERINLKTKSGSSMNESKFKEILSKHFKPKGGGGTSFIPPFQWIEKNLLSKGTIPSFVIYFTDAQGPAPTQFQYGIKRYYDKVLWVITDTQEAPNIKWPAENKLFIDK